MGSDSWQSTWSVCKRWTSRVRGSRSSHLRDRVHRIYEYRTSRWAYGLVQRVAIVAFFPYFRVRFRGERHLNAEGAVIIASVHRSHLDAPLIAGVGKHRSFRSLAKEALFSNWILAGLLASLGAFPGAQ